MFPCTKQNKSAFESCHVVPTPARSEEISPKALFVLCGADFLKSTPRQLIWGTDRCNHCFQDNRMMSSEFCTGFMLRVCVLVCVWVHIILSNFHNAEMVGGADMVIQDWTPWIRLGLSGQHSGSRLKLFSHTCSLGKSWGHYWFELLLVSSGKLPSDICYTMRAVLGWCPMDAPETHISGLKNPTDL